MPLHATDIPAQLRVNAEQRLKTGTAPATRGWPTGAQALALLYGLASQPARAGDALKLLHELQVHQVELDLQHEQAVQVQSEQADTLAHYTALFDAAPFGYVTLDTEGRVADANRIGGAWLRGTEGNEHWAGCCLVDLVVPEDRPVVRDLLGGLRQVGGRQTCALRASAGGTCVQVVASACATGLLLAFMPANPADAGLRL